MHRDRYLQKIQEHFSVHSVCGLLGPRQCGKTTLARHFCELYQKENPTEIHQFDCENPDDFESLQNPMRVLERLKGLVVIDEIQHIPDLFKVLRVLVDQKQAQYLVLGSASRDLLQQSSETLAGRIGYIELTPFHLKESTESYIIKPETLMLRGGFPSSYMAKNDSASFLWRESYIQTFLERDIPALGFQIPPMQLRRFWMMLVHMHGQQFNAHQLATSLGVSGHKIRTYLDILVGTFMMRVLQPWFENIGKRVAKTPKIYFRDSGVLLTLTKLNTENALMHHPLLGAVWEGFALEQTLQALEIRSEEAFYWRTSHGAELDLLIHHNGERFGFEFKFADAPKRTKSMLIAFDDLKLKHLYVIYPGSRSYPIADNMTVMSIAQLRTFSL